MAPDAGSPRHEEVPRTCLATRAPALVRHAITANAHSKRSLDRLSSPHEAKRSPLLEQPGSVVGPSPASSSQASVKRSSNADVRIRIRRSKHAASNSGSKVCVSYYAPSQASPSQASSSQASPSQEGPSEESPSQESPSEAGRL